MQIPREVKNIIQKLEKAGFEAYLVGGCVRDFLLGKEPKDWDITTNACPEEIVKIFPEGRYENKFGTVIIGEIEVTTYRLEAKYTDKRHPDAVKFTARLEDDLSRRDFTVNAMAGEAQSVKRKAKSRQNNLEIIDPFLGQKDLEEKLIRAVGKPEERFSEDALRMLRAVRFACELDFEIEEETAFAIKKLAQNLKYISGERIRDELTKIVMSEKAEEGARNLYSLGLLAYIIPELLAGVGMNQPKHHIYTVFEHGVRSLGFCKSPKLSVRLAALLHDIAKPATRQGEGEAAHFYGHNTRGAYMARAILYRLKYPREVIEQTAHLIRHHMFVYNIGEVTEAGVRRLLAKVGPENIADLIDLRVADRLGSGCPKAKPYKLRHLEYMLDKVSADPISVKMLKINGEDVMRILEIKPSAKIGLILNSLLAEVIDNPKLNNKKTLEKRVLELAKIPDNNLKAKFNIIDQEKKKADLSMREKHWLGERDNI
ncbi:MAG: CCA tRNA nucleotidyltransferase [bacterium]|nr:CCA tRNA nucleotidyltransferase [bacterium]